MASNRYRPSLRVANGPDTGLDVSRFKTQVPLLLVLTSKTVAPAKTLLFRSRSIVTKTKVAASAVPVIVGVLSFVIEPDVINGIPGMLINTCKFEVADALRLPAVERTETL